MISWWWTFPLLAAGVVLGLALVGWVIWTGLRS